jgi:hypothetical protein
MRVEKENRLFSKVSITFFKTNDHTRDKHRENFESYKEFI